MLISTLDEVEFAPDYPELVGKRVLVTGVRCALGVEIVRAFAEAQARLVVHTTEDTPEMLALAEIIAPAALDVHFHAGPLETPDAMLKFTREAAQRFGCLDCVINLATVPEPPNNASEREVEALVTDALAMPVLATRVIANRMRTMLSPGAALNILTIPANASGSHRLVAGIARNALAHFTRAEAEAAASDGISINGVVPAVRDQRDVASLCGTVDVATLALHLASGRHDLSGLLFEAWCG